MNEQDILNHIEEFENDEKAMKFIMPKEGTYTNDKEFINIFKELNIYKFNKLGYMPDDEQLRVIIEYDKYIQLYQLKKDVSKHLEKLKKSK